MIKKLVFAVLAALAIAACGESRGYSRGIFHGLMIDKTEEQVASKLGKPVEVQTFDADNVRYVYTKKTFDPDNLNQVDERTIIEFGRKDGKLVVVDVTFG